MQYARDFFTFSLICDGREIATPIAVSCAAGCAPIHHCTAIWDTGATSSMISADLAKELDLKPEGSVKVSGVHGVEDAKLYTIDLIFGTGFKIEKLQVSEAGNNAGFDVLIGMDVISKGMFIVNGGNHAEKGCQIAFAFPANS